MGQGAVAVSAQMLRDIACEVFVDAIDILLMVATLEASNNRTLHHACELH
jgi:hypothetical protein